MREQSSFNDLSRERASMARVSGLDEALGTGENNRIPTVEGEVSADLFACVRADFAARREGERNEKQTTAGRARCAHPAFGGFANARGYRFTDHPLISRGEADRLERPSSIRKQLSHDEPTRARSSSRRRRSAQGGNAPPHAQHRLLRCRSRSPQLLQR